MENITQLCFTLKKKREKKSPLKEYLDLVHKFNKQQPEIYFENIHFLITKLMYTKLKNRKKIIKDPKNEKKMRRYFICIFKKLFETILKSQFKQEIGFYNETERFLLQK